ncbi:OLC1v1035924C1 [Oldenlandia corymbosa var. corymbosa]|uniref:OLC1v1035924C1 n=1 Tax=Oldenlandia corymbosa var. corymbosa TaxID=529605 RepID=A0AAV1CXI6_OLDCO|nr:OLC1v1035924C1 [Oldenlandia corymbosa var. corymbosa]
MIDHRHILIGFDLEEDFQRCWMKEFWSFDSHMMRVLKWTQDFNPEQESSIVPVWIAFEGLPVHRFNEEYLRKISCIVGKPLKIDMPTLNLSRPSIARVCVEVDLLQELPKRIRLGTEGSSYFQIITYENLLEYYVECRKIGHSIKACRHSKDFTKADAIPKSNPKPNEAQNQETISKKSEIKASAKPFGHLLVGSWKQKEDATKNSEKITQIGNDPSSSGLTLKEKQTLQIDVEALSPKFHNPSSTNRKISKEHLSEILEKSSEKQHPMESWGTEEVVQVETQEEIPKQNEMIGNDDSIHDLEVEKDNRNDEDDDDEGLLSENPGKISEVGTLLDQFSDDVSVGAQFE